ncbi:MAG: sulfatase [Pseudomonadota bacterium]
MLRSLFYFCTFLSVLAAPSAWSRPNLLLITLDDLNADSVGVFGAHLPGTTPRIDALAAEGMRFDLAHVQVANCMPSRNVLWSGRYPHSSRVLGFYPVLDPGYPMLPDLMRQAGYFAGIYNKVHDSTPYEPYPWDMVLNDSSALVGAHKKNPEDYGRALRVGIGAAAAAKKPFVLVMNVSDAHVPFYGLNRRSQPRPDPYRPSRVFAADEVPVPAYLVEDPEVRFELAHYFSSVRRADDAVGAMLSTLEELDLHRDTLVMVLADHGMPFPFVKTQLYHHSTRTPLIVRWPDTVPADTVDREHMVSAVDVLPTLLDVVEQPLPAGLQGRSFLGLLRGGKQQQRDAVFKEYHENSAGQPTPMRAIETPRFLYIYNPWSDGARQQFSATFQTLTYQRMEQLAGQDEALAARIALLRYRVPEELYDVQSDPDCLHNLIDDPNYRAHLDRLRARLADWMARTSDPLLRVFENRQDTRQVEAYMAEQMRQAKIHRELKAEHKARQRSPQL